MRDCSPTTTARTTLSGCATRRASSATSSLTSQTITRVPVPVVTTLATASGDVGYIQFNDHIATAEDDLEAAIDSLKDENVTDLILDLRYNGGGYLDMASELSYMVANTTLTSGRTFEKLVFNDKNPTRDPVTGELLTPTPFHSTSQGFSGAAGRRFRRSISTASTSSRARAPVRPASPSSTVCAA